MTDVWTIKKMLLWTSDYFQSKGLETPRLDAEILLAHVLGLRRLDLYLQFERPLNQEELTQYKTLIKQRLAHEPVAYLVGKKEFWSRDFFVTSDVLIPRPDTEMLVEVVLAGFRRGAVVAPGRDNTNLGRDNPAPTVQGFELGLGSGNVSITLLAEIPGLKMTAAEISSTAIAVASKNAAFYGVEDRLEIIESDFLHERIRNSLGKYGFIVSNPPYVRSIELSHLPDTVKNYEPTLALDGGPDGLDYYRALSSFSQNHLKDDGFLAVEIGEDQADDVCKIFESSKFSQLHVIKDLAARNRVVLATCYAKS